jgi:hypothetical protein
MKMRQMNLFEQNAKKINEAEKLEAEQEEQMELDGSFLQEQRQLIERDTITISDVGPWGIQWRGANIPLPNSMFENDHIAQFGFSCAGCGASAINQEKLIHFKQCDSKSPHHREED